MLALDSICTGECACVVKIYTADELRRRLFDIGLAEGTKVTCVGISPAGDPLAFLIRGSVFALRKCDCRRIFVTREGRKS